MDIIPSKNMLELPMCTKCKKYFYSGSTGRDRRGSTDLETLLEYYGSPLVEHKFVETTFVMKLPEIYFTEDLKGYKISKKNGIFYLRAGFLSSERNIYMFCDFCENYSLSESVLRTCGSCYNNLCSACYNVCCERSIDCPFCFKNCFEYSKSQYLRSKLFYYCRFNCNKFFKGSELMLHENSCHLNKNALLSDSEYGNLHFGIFFIESTEDSETIVERENKVRIDKDRLGKNGKIYVVTDYNFKCIIFYKSVGDNYSFRVFYKYPSHQFFVLIRVVEEGTVREDANNFTVDISKAPFLVVLFRNKEISKNQDKKSQKQKEYFLDVAKKVFCLTGCAVLSYYFWDNIVHKAKCFMNFFKDVLIDICMRIDKKLMERHDKERKNKKPQKEEKSVIKMEGIFETLIFDFLGIIVSCIEHINTYYI